MNNDPQRENLTFEALIQREVWVTGSVLDDKNSNSMFLFLKNNLITTINICAKNSVFLSLCNMLMVQKLDISNDS